MTDELKPVAWKVHAPDSHYFELRRFPMGGLLIENGWTETPLYTADQLAAARTQGWNEAIEAAAEQCELWANKLRLALKNAQARKQQEEARDLESIAMSVFRAFETRALTKENSDA